jgi:starch synthase
LLADAGLRGRMGQAGRERIREHFTWPAVTDLTIQAYEDALAG